MPANGTPHSGTAGAANMSKKKRHKPKALKGVRRGVSHRMDREMNTPRPGPWANRVYY